MKKVEVRGLERPRVVPALWAFAIDVTGEGEEAAALVCDGADVARPEDPPRIVWTTGPVRPREPWATWVRWPLRSTPTRSEAPTGTTVEAMLATLRIEYQDQLPDTLAELASAVIELPRGPRETHGASWTDARMLAHRLRGTAGSYGQPAVSEAAGRLEELLVGGTVAPGRLAEGLADLAAAVLVGAGAKLPEMPRVVAIGAGPTDAVQVPNITAAARMIAAGEGHALWICDVDDAVIAGEPGLRDVPVAFVRAGAGPDVLAVARACVWPDPWARLYAPRA